MRTVYDPMYHGECNRSEIKCQEYASQGETPLLEHTLQGDIKDITGSLECPLAPPFPPEMYGFTKERKRKFFKKPRKILRNAYEYYKRGRHATFLDSLLDAWIEEYFEEYMYHNLWGKNHTSYNIDNYWEDPFYLKGCYFEFETQEHRFEYKWQVFLSWRRSLNLKVWNFYKYANWGAEIWYHAYSDWYDEKFQLREDGAEDSEVLQYIYENRKRKWLL